MRKWYTEIHVFLAVLVQESLYNDSVGQSHYKKLFHAKLIVNTCPISEIGFFTEEEGEGDRELEFYICILRVLSCTCRPWLITAALKSSEWFHYVRA